MNLRGWRCGDEVFWKSGEKNLRRRSEGTGDESLEVVRRKGGGQSLRVLGEKAGGEDFEVEL